MEEKDHQVVGQTKDDHRPQQLQDSGTDKTIIQPFIIRAPNENEEDNGRSSPLATIDHENPSADGRVITSQLIYGVEDVPPWNVSLFLGFQHYLTMFCATVPMPFILTPALCIEDNDPARSYVMSTIIFVSGMITFLQTTFGVRLPTIQGGTFAFLIPAIAILSMPEWQCPNEHVMANMTYDDKTELWQLRMREIQGAVILASFFEMFIGFFGIIGLIFRFITPLTIAPAVTMLGLSLFGVAGNMAGKHWGISSLVIFLILLFSQYLRHIKIPVPSYERKANNGHKRSWTIKKWDAFQLLPVLLSLLIAWGLCAILTMTNVLDEKSSARTDTKISILAESPWFRVPYPGQWGLPTFSVSAAIGMCAGVISSIISSIGDYYACARLAGAPSPPVTAVNRGILVEGFGCLLAGLWGSGMGTNSYTENSGIIAITKVGSRRVIQASACMMLFFGVMSKFGALFITIPEPIIGGIFCIMFGMITAAGLSNLQFVNLNSTRNLVVLGFSVLFSLVVSQWIKNNPGAINTGSIMVDQIFTILLGAGIFIAGVLGFILDNTVPGTDEERGLNKWLTVSNKSSDSSVDGNSSASLYHIPYITPWLKKQSWTSYLPFLPSYEERSFSSIFFCSKS